MKTLVIAHEAQELLDLFLDVDMSPDYTEFESGLARFRLSQHFKKITILVDADGLIRLSTSYWNGDENDFLEDHYPETVEIALEWCQLFFDEFGPSLGDILAKEEHVKSNPVIIQDFEDIDDLPF